MTTTTMRHYVICTAYCATALSAAAADALVETLDAGECNREHVAIDAVDRATAMAKFARHHSMLTLVSTP